MKTCNRCIEEKDLSLFYKNKDGLFGVKSICKECEKKNKIEYGLQYPERIREKNRKYYLLHGYKQQNWSSVSEKIKIGNRLRCRLRNALKGKIKSQPTWDLLGISMQEFKSYMINKFTDGMTWELLLEGKIHIDHIIPCARFDLNDQFEQNKCFHYTNLQPLRAFDNYVKNKY